MGMDKVIIVGQNPSSVEKSGTFRKLNQWTAEWKLNSGYDFMNCSEEYGQKYTIDYDSLKVTSKYDKVIALGNVASNSLKKLNIDHFKMPHPSGLNRQLNDKEFEKTKIKECYNYLYT